jgi:hypothetical protein
MAYKDREDRKKNSKKHYEANKKEYKKRAFEHRKKAKKRNRKYVEDYLKNHPCVDCGEKDIIVLEFDHVKDKKVINISKSVNSGWSIERIKQEIEKCEVRCANCHRRVTHKRRHIAG